MTLEVGSASLEPGKAGAFRAAPDGTARLLLKADPTSELVWHELGHFIQWRRLGSDAYRALPRSTSFNAPEQFVFDLLEQPTRWYRRNRPVNGGFRVASGDAKLSSSNDSHPREAWRWRSRKAETSTGPA